MTKRCSDHVRPIWHIVALLAALLASVPFSGFAFGRADNLQVPDSPPRELAPSGTRIVVLLFFATDCPLSDRYQPEVTKLSHAFRDRGVQFWMVYPNPSQTRAAIEAHQKEVSQDIAPLLDPGQGLVRLAGARVTPEAAVFRVTPQGLQRVYRGRIDDRYLSLGTQRPVALHHDLADAIDAALAGKPVRPAGGKAVGCSIIPLP